MATVSPSPDSAPAGVPPVSSSPPPLPSTPPQPSTTPPPAQTSPPLAQPNANPPDPSAPSPPSPPPNAPPPSNTGTPIVTPPPPTPSAPPPTAPVSPPPTPSTVSPPPVPSVSPPPPTTNPPVNSPPPAVVPPPSTPVNPPTVSPPPPTSSTPPTSSPSPPATPPPTSTPTPPSANPPSNPPPSPPSPNPPEGSPPPASRPPETSPPPAAPTSPVNPPPPSPSSSQPPRSPPSPPAASPPRNSPPRSRGTPPPSNPDPASPPSMTPGAPPGLQLSPPPPGLVSSSPGLPVDRPSPDAPETTNNAPSPGGIGTGGAVAIGVVVGLLMLGLIGLVGVWIFKRKKKSSGPYDGHVIPASIGSSPRSDGKLLVTTEYPGSNFGGSGSDTPIDHGGYGHSRSWFTYQELYDATSGFSDEKLLGEGGFGRVYKGLLSDGRVIAVKQLKVGGGQGEREFKAEVEIISRIHHRHLVSLVGYCILEDKRLLVYEYVPNNTLHFHLHGNGRPVLEWATRVKIAIGAARGITYLHEDCHPRIIHRDIKSTNILIDNNYESRVADFGLAKLAMDAETHVSTRVMGTFGYMAPEYATSGKLTEKSDVFSYGVVLLELITGRKPVDESQPLGDESLVEWARPLLAHALETGELEGLVDERLEKNYIESEMLRMIEAAAACVRHSAIKRPRMGLVLRALSMSDSGDLSNGLRVGESQLYDSAQQSAEIRWFQRMAFGGSQDISSDFFSNPSQNLGFSGQSRRNVDLSTQHEYNRNSQNVGFPNQSGNNVNFSAERHSSQHNQGNKNPSFNREGSVNRMIDL